MEKALNCDVKRRNKNVTEDIIRKNCYVEKMLPAYQGKSFTEKRESKIIRRKPGARRNYQTHGGSFLRLVINQSAQSSIKFKNSVILKTYYVSHTPR